MRALRFLMTHLETTSQVAMLISTVAVVLLTAIGVIYAARTYWNPPTGLTIAGVSAGETLVGTAILRINSTGRPYDSLTVRIDDENGIAVWERAVDSSAPISLDTTELGDGEYVMVVDVKKGRSSLKSAMLPFLIDNTGPNITVLGLAAQDTVRGVVTVAWSVAPPDEAAIVEALLDEEMVIGPGQLDTRWLADGYHNIRASTTDRMGNRSQVFIPFVSDNSPPDATIDGVPSSGYVGLDQEITVVVEDAGPVVVNWYLNGTSERPIAAGPVLACNLLPPGEQVLRVEIRDAAGNELMLEQALTKDDEAPAVIDALGHDKLVMHPDSLLWLGYYAQEPVTQTIVADGKVLTGRWLRLSDMATSDQISLIVQYTDRAGNRSEKTMEVLLDESVRGTSGFVRHLGRVWSLSVLNWMLRTVESLVKSWSALGIGVTGWRALPPWEEEQGGIGFVRLPGGIDIYSSFRKGLFGARVPVFGLGQSTSAATSHLLLDIGGYRRTESHVLLTQGEVGGAPWVYEQSIISGAWAKLCPAIDLAQALLPAPVNELVSVEISVGAGVSLHSETHRLALLHKYTNRYGDVQSYTEFELCETSLYGGMFPVFQLAISIAPLPVDLRDAMLSDLE